ncbi:MAG: response regulator [Patescibacteria group bacterium]
MMDKENKFKKKILVIEDNENNFYLIKFLLEANRYEVVRAHNGLDGIEKAQTQKPDLILMDVQLPKLDGYTATQRIKAIPDLNKIPIIALTSYAMQGDREKAKAAGCDDYIPKPIDPTEVLKTLQNFLGGEN